MKKNKTTWIISGAILLLSYVACRYGLLDLHGMHDWPLVLLIAGGLIFLISLVFKCRYIPIFTAVGYPAAFAVGVIFQWGGMDPRGWVINRLWLVWMVTYLCVIAAGGIVEGVTRKRSK